MATIRILDDGTQPVVEKGKEPPLKQGNFYVLEVEDDIARYWNKQSPKRREDLYKQSVKEKKDIRLILDGFVHKPAHTK